MGQQQVTPAKPAIERGVTVYLDTHPIIYLTEANPAFKKSMTGLFKALEDAHAQVVTSEF